MVAQERVRTLNDGLVGSGPVVYWMQRDQRAIDNWALLYAQERALSRHVPVVVVFTFEIIPHRAHLRHYDFMFRGLKEVQETLLQYNIPFFLLEGKAVESLHTFVETHGISEVVTDFSPLRYARSRRDSFAKISPVLVSEVDAHNIIPCWQLSDKEEFAAYTIRPKVHRKLAEYLVPFPKLKTHPHTFVGVSPIIEVDTLLNTKGIDDAVYPVTTFVPGYTHGLKQLKTFISSRLDRYDEDRNNPTLRGVSDLSPYLHFGQLGAQTIALAVSETDLVPAAAKESFLEELIVRRELADNYCFYNKAYDQVAGAHAWAQKTITEHAKDKREYLYTKEQLEAGETHDDLWNAMQQQMIQEGKMHGWCRMYWAKKILEWTPDTQTAIDIGLYLNDKYELDGNDPNGVVGVMWSVCGVHDRAWNERPIFGKIRYMNYAGAKRKFDIKAYIERYGKKDTLFT